MDERKDCVNLFGESAVGSGGAIPEIQSTETHWSGPAIVLSVKRRNRIPFPADNLSPFDSEKIFTFFSAEFSFSPISLSAAPGRRYGQRCSRPQNRCFLIGQTPVTVFSLFFLCQLCVWSIGRDDKWPRF
jgi:hypothetical protein